MFKGVGQCLTSKVKCWAKVTWKGTQSRKLNRRPAEKNRRKTDQVNSDSGWDCRWISPSTAIVYWVLYKWLRPFIDNSIFTKIQRKIRQQEISFSSNKSYLGSKLFQEFGRSAKPTWLLLPSHRFASKGQQITDLTKSSVWLLTWGLQMSTHAHECC